MPRAQKARPAIPPRFVPKNRKDFTLALVQAIHPLSTAFKRLRPQQPGGQRLGPAMYAVLDVLHRASDWNVPILARGLMLDRQSVQRVVNQLVERALLVRVPETMNKRSPIIKLTARGVAALKEHRAAQWSELKSLVSPLRLEWLAACDEVLQHIRIKLAFSHEHEYSAQAITRVASSRRPRRRST